MNYREIFTDGKKMPVGKNTKEVTLAKMYFTFETQEYYSTRSLINWKVIWN